MLVYMILQFVLGTAYFVLIVVILSFSLSFIAIPILQELFRQGYIIGDNVRYFFPTLSTWMYPILIATGLLLWTTFMNLARGIGQLHGRFAKWLLVSE